MSNPPFGFSNSDDDPDRDKGRDGEGSPGPGGIPFGFTPEGFDPTQLGQMLTQFGQMLSGMGSAMGTGGSGPVNYDLAKKLALQQLGSVAPISSGTGTAVADAAHLAEVWLDGATTLPCLLYTSPSPRDLSTSRMPSSA